MLICYCAIVRKCVCIRMRPKLILGLVIIAAGTMDSCYINVLRLDISYACGSGCVKYSDKNARMILWDYIRYLI